MNYFQCLKIENMGRLIYIGLAEFRNFFFRQLRTSLVPPRGISNERSKIANN